MTTQSMPGPTIDSHQHFWDIERLEYPWMPPGDNVLRRNYLPEDLAPLLKRALVSKTIVVQAQQTMAETEFLFEIADANDFVAGVVPWVDLTDPMVGKTLDKLGRNKKFVGVRHQVHDEPNDRWLLRPDVLRGLSELAERGIAYDLLLRPRHLEYVPRLADRVPDLRMVVDHIAKPLIAEGALAGWADEIADVAAIPTVYCKISGLVTEADHNNWKPSDLRQYVSHVIDVFGWDRIMWGSDWPVCLLAVPNYDEVKHATMEAIGDCTHEQWMKLMGRNAMDFYRLGG